jgi:hypothetical protein
MRRRPRLQCRIIADLAFLTKPKGPVNVCGISVPFETLSPAEGKVTYVFLTRPPLYSGCPFLARLACVKPAANVRSEPGSNSP